MAPKRGRSPKSRQLGELFIAALLVVTVAAPVEAQDKPREQPGQSQEPIPLPELTVPGLLDQYNPPTSTTGTKIEVPLRDVPQSIQVLPRQLIDDQRAITLSDVLRNVSGFSPSVNSQSQRFGDRSVIFRGFTVNNYYTNGYKDPFNGTSFTAGLGNIERVEVVKGPSSVLYGMGDPGATINIITKQPLPEWYAAGSVTAGSFGYVSPSVDVSGPLTPDKALRFRLNAAYQREDSFVDFVESQRYLVAPVVSLSLGADTRLTLEGEYQALSEIYWTGQPAEGSIRKNPNGKIPISRYLGDADLEGNDFPERTLAKIGYRLDHRLNEHVALRHGLRITYHTRDERDILPSGLQEDLRTFDRDLFIARRVFGNNRVWIDQYSGQILQARELHAMSAGDVVLEWQFPLHSGEAFGLPGRIVVFTAGLAPTLLAVTGATIWWRKSRTRRAFAGRRSVAR